MSADPADITAAPVEVAPASGADAGPDAGPDPGEADLGRVLEALLVVTDTPLVARTLAAALGVTDAEVTSRLEALSEEFEAGRRGFRLRATAAGWSLFAAPEHRELLERVVLDSQPARLTQAALETLAVVAYQQPVSRGRIAAVRGVNVDAVMRTLVSRGLIAEVGTDPATGALLFATTTLFLEKLGIHSLDELPALAPLLPENEALNALVDEISTLG